MAGNYDEQILGSEPVRIDPPLKSLADIRLAEVLNWYRHFFDLEQAKSWLAKWMVGEYPKTEIDAVSSIVARSGPFYVCVLAKLVLNGNILPDDAIERMKNVVQDLIVKSKEPIKVTLSETHAAEGLAKFRANIKAKTEETIAHIEERLDDFFRGNFMPLEIDLTNYLIEREIGAANLRLVMAKYNDLLDEIRQETETLTKTQRKNYVAFLEKLIDDIQKAINLTANTSARTPRKKKTKSAAQMTSKMKYQNSDKELGVSSIAPDKIIGAKLLWLYNTKYKKLTKLVASDNKGLYVKGQTILGYDEDQSETKIVRKPNTVVPSILQMSKIDLRKVMTDLKTKPSLTSGRIGSDTIILRADK